LDEPTQVEAHVPPSGFADLMLAVADANLSPLRDRSNWSRTEPRSCRESER
jgi:hypothetical protein